MTAVSDHAALMDRIYRGQRLVYDVTRKYFLFGRDALIRKMEVKPGDHILEVGVGTARNLVLLARRHSAARLFGVDASREMLRSAEMKVSRAGLSGQIKLAFGYAEDCSPQQTFGMDRLFDVIFFSYSLSMIPNWQAALVQALKNLKTGGKLYVVDFWDQRTYPRLFQRALRSWLSQFHVQFRPEHLDFLRQIAARENYASELQGVGGSYAYIACLTKCP